MARGPLRTQRSLCIVALLVCVSVSPVLSQLTGYRRVHAWGLNRFGELGIENVPGQANRAKPNQCEPQFVPTLGHEQLEAVQENLQRIVSGHNHVVAITDEGSLYVWGRNDRGQLGLGFTGSQDIRSRFKPTLLKITNDNGQKQEVIDVAVGLEHTLAVVNGGRVYAWGSNQYGQLGINEKPEVIPYTSVPTAIDIGGESIMNVSAAAGHSVALTFTGAVYTWGANQEGQLGLGGCRNPEGRGLDPCLNYVRKPTKILQTSEGSFLPQMKLIAAGGHVAGGTERFLEGGHTATVSKMNEVWGWGDNFHGQVGKKQEYVRVANNTEVFTSNKFDNVTGKYYNREVLPVRVGPLIITTSQPPPPPPPPFQPISPPMPMLPWAPGATGPSNSTAPVGTVPTTSAPTFFTPSGQTAEQNGVPEIIALASGSHHTLALVESGEMFAWGDNFFGQLGLGYQSLLREPNRFHKTRTWRQPEMIDTPQRIKHFDYNVVEKRVEVQRNATVEISYTVQITGKIKGTPKDNEGNEATITQIDAGNFQSIALSRDGAIYTWGTNSLGQQGTCDCGACAESYDAAGYCAPVTAPPAPPAPTAEELNKLDPLAPPGPSYEYNQVWEESCECNCAGQGTCKYTPPIGDLDAINQGTCVGYGAETKCECTPPYLQMTGAIYNMDQPMNFALGAKTDFSFVTIAAGGAMFAVSQSNCPNDDLGRECAGKGECVSPDEGNDELPKCSCPFGTAGLFCEHSCPVGTKEDVDAIRADHNIVKFPKSRYREDVDGKIAGEVCAGHGVCDTKGACVCEDNWFGDRCQYMCPWDEYKRPCSGNGTCAYDPTVQENPYCVCDRWNTIDKDPEVAAANVKICEEKKLAVYTNGWCSYYDATQGFVACYSQGMCGVCEDGAMRASLSLTFVVGILIAVTHF